MATNVDALKSELARLKREIEALEARISKIEGPEAGTELPFVRMLGAWKGADFTEEEIDAVKVRVKPFPE
jgi:hypothetical protein